MLYTHCYYVIKVQMGAIWLLGIIGALTEETSIEFLVKAITDSIESYNVVLKCIVYYIHKCINKSTK